MIHPQITPQHDKFPASKEVDLDYYSRKPYKIITGGIDDDAPLILGDCGHTGRYGINIAGDMPLAKVFLCDLNRDSSTKPALPPRAKETKQNADALPSRDSNSTNNGANNVFVIAAGAALINISLPFKDDSFNVVYSFELENYVNYQAVFAELTRVLKPRGKMIIGVPNYYNYFHTMRKNALKKKGLPLECGYEKSFKHTELESLFTENGLKDVKITGVAPMQSLMRLSKVSKYKRILNFFRWWSLIKIIDLTLVRLIDLLTIGKFSYKFGFEIIAVGIKE